MPPSWLRGPHGQTMVGRLLRPKLRLEVTRVRWETPDGDFLDCDVLDSDPLGGVGSDGCVLILHGLEGSSRRSYVRILMSHLAAHGLRSFALNFRGCSGEPNRLPRAYHSGETEDTAFAIERIREAFPGQPVAAIGFSLGGNVLLKYLGETGAGSPLTIAVAISVPFDLDAAADAIGTGFGGRVYTGYFLRSLKSKLRAKTGILTSPLLRLGLAARDLRAFDDAVTAPLHGFDGALDYYARCSSSSFLGRVTTPCLLIQSLDDPFLPRVSLPTALIDRNPNLKLVAPERGGHLGFLQQTSAVDGKRRSTRRFWAESEAARFVAEHLI